MCNLSLHCAIHSMLYQSENNYRPPTKETSQRNNFPMAATKISRSSLFKYSTGSGSTGTHPVLRPKAAQSKIEFSMSQQCRCKNRPRSLGSDVRTQTVGVARGEDCAKGSFPAGEGDFYISVARAKGLKKVFVKK